MEEKSKAELVAEKVENKAKPREPDPMVPPVTPIMVAQKVAEGSRFWAFLPVPICVEYDVVQKMGRTGRVAVEKEIRTLIKAQIGSPRKQKGKDAWVVKVEYPTDPGIVVGDTCDRLVGQIRAAIGELV